MIDQLIQQLDDISPARRKEAILALGKSRDMAALRPLARVYRSDPDPEVRELARKAGVYIRQQNEGASAPSHSNAPTEPLTSRSSAPAAPPMPRTNAPVMPSAPPSNESYTERRMRELEEQKRAAAEAAQPQTDPDEARRRPIRGREYRVPQEAKDRAKLYVDAALTYNLDGENAKAMKNLTEALSLNPNLVNDAYFNSVAASVTELDGDAAIDMIVDRGKRKEFVTVAKGVTKQAKIEKHMSVAGQTSWMDVGWEVVLYTLIMSIGPVLQTLVSMQSAQNFFNALTLSAEGMTEMPQIVTDAQNSMMLLTAGTLIPVGFISGIVGVGGLILQLVLVHYMSTMLLDGHGTIRHLLTTLLAHYNRGLPLLFLISYISTALFFVTAGSPVTACLAIILVIQTVRVLGKTSSLIGQAYDYGMLRGCVALNLANLLVTGAVLLVMLLLFQSIGTAALETFFRLNPTAIPPVQ